MHRHVRIAALITAAMAVAAGAPKVAQAISNMELFRVATVEVEGLRYLEREDVAHTAAVPEGSSVWDDSAPIAERLEGHPGIRGAGVRRKFPGTLVLEIEERVPVALYPNPTLVPVDAEDMLLPFDPAGHRVDLPLVQPHRTGSTEGGAGPALTPVQIRTLAAELDRLSRVRPDLAASVSDVALDAWGDVVLRIEEPAVALRYALPLSPNRLEEGLVVLADVLDRNPGHTPIEVDLRFADQVVVRLSPSRGR
jgi:cell division septal protein FtsQ